MKSKLLVPVFLLLTALAWAQDSNFKLDVNVDLVEVHVTVVDDKDRPVGGLLQDQFQVLEDRVVQPITVFKHEDIPVSLGLVIDNSRSIEPRKARLDAAALSFVRRSNATDETFIVNFDSDARMSQDFTSNISDLERTLAAVKPYGQTAIYDAMELALKHMEKAKYSKKAILLVTDGIDNASKTTLAAILDLVKRSRVAVYTVGLLSASGGEKAQTDLVSIAETSGGRAYFPGSPEEAHVMMERIAKDLREQYTLGYFPTNGNRDGAWRSVRVLVTPPPGFPSRLTTNYRLGYYGPGK